MPVTSPSGLSVGNVFTKETLTKGRPDAIQCIEIGGQTFTISRGPLAVVSLEDEWYEDVTDPESVVAALRQTSGLRADIFTFWQRMPEVTPKYSYHREWEDIAVLPITTYDHWFKEQIKSRVRSLIRKAEKEGVVVSEAEYDDDFVKGMTSIFNESPIRQGRRFWHYGKDFETVKSQFSRYVHRERMIAAHYQGEMIGFMMLGIAGKYALTGQIISGIRHRDKSTNNALIAKAVEVCAAQNLPYLVYLFWSDDSLAEFKRRCGFEKVSVPRYYIPLSSLGAVALKTGMHRGWKAMLPKRLKDALKRARGKWYGNRVE